jgi:hypothetical protein
VTLATMATNTSFGHVAGMGVDSHLRESATDFLFATVALKKQY